MKTKLGCHVSFKEPDYFLGSVNEALSYGANALMIYTGAPQNTKRKEIDILNVEQGYKILKSKNITNNELIIHAPYILNLGNMIKPDILKFSIEFLKRELYRCQSLQAKVIVLHPGASLDANRYEVIAQITKALNEVITKTKDLDVVIALETMAGKGTEIGKNFEELAQIILGITDKKRIGVCLDTCHTWDAGYDWKNKSNEVIATFDKVIGLDYLKVVHLNDSKNPLGSAKDRHANIGEGYMGEKVLKTILYHPKLKHLPFILETPFKDGKPLFKEEISQLKNKEI